MPTLTYNLYDSYVMNSGHDFSKIERTEIKRMIEHKGLQQLISKGLFFGKLKGHDINVFNITRLIANDTGEITYDYYFLDNDVALQAQHLLALDRVHFRFLVATEPCKENNMVINKVFEIDRVCIY